MKLLITGGAGYVGAMLTDQFASRPDVEGILIIDKEKSPKLLEEHPEKKKITYIEADLQSDIWQERATKFEPEIIIHTAWDIREIYKKKKEKERSNIEATDKLFDLAFRIPGVKKIIHFSSVAPYGAHPQNDIDYFFTESEALRSSEYSYAEEKRIAEAHLKEKYEENLKRSLTPKALPQVFVLRPVSITGPRGRFMRVKFGLQSALSGQLKENFIHHVVSLMVAFVPVTPKWLRQFIHEDDVAHIVELLVFNTVDGKFEVFNTCPPGPSVTGKDMAKAVRKKRLFVRPWMVRFIFFLAWHGTRGRVPTSRGVWKAYSYPIAIDGSRITKHTGFQYKYSSYDAFVNTEGRYSKYVK